MTNIDWNRVLAIALRDGRYIDIDSHQGEDYLNGTASKFTKDEIETAAKDLRLAYESEVARIEGK